MQYRHDSADRPPLPGNGHMEDYTTAFLWSAGGLIFMALFALWAAWGLPVVLALAWITDRLTRRR